ncbi:MAG: helix-turn-helix domain-containing protein [Candidatus Bathyarchaeia archaeon]|jgi:DNA-binding PadR family transcriptional regulator
MSLEQQARILQVVISRPCGVRDIIKLLKIKSSNIVSLLRRMEDEKLIEVQFAKGPKRGRPKKCIAASSLGYDFLDSYKKLNLKLLTARKAELDHAVKDAMYASRLAESGHSTFQVFMELNTIASNIKNSP